MFQFPTFAPSYDGDMPSACQVAPFGNHRIKACLQLHGAYRSLPRPSSPTEAQASTVRSCNLLSVSFDTLESQELVFTLVLRFLVAFEIAVHNS